LRIENECRNEGRTTGMTLRDATVAVRLPAQDLHRARTWYSDKLGLEPIEERDGGLRYVLGGTEFCLFLSQGGSDGSFTQMALTVSDIGRVVAELRERGVVFEEYDAPGLATVNGIATIAGNYPSKGSGELAAWFRDSEGNMIGLGETVP
jgi:catechol 2,3-dioxygenase-like lactoylglutathione lyase family enzyme